MRIETERYTRGFAHQLAALDAAFRRDLICSADYATLRAVRLYEALDLSLADPSAELREQAEDGRWALVAADGDDWRAAAERDALGRLVVEFRAMEDLAALGRDDGRAAQRARAGLVARTVAALRDLTGLDLSWTVHTEDGASFPPGAHPARQTETALLDGGGVQTLEQCIGEQIRWLIGDCAPQAQTPTDEGLVAAALAVTHATDSARPAGPQRSGSGAR